MKAKGRLLALLAVVVILGLATAAGAKPANPGTLIMLAVPAEVGADGVIDLAVFAGLPTGSRVMSYDCFADPAYTPAPVYSVVIIDETASVQRLVTGVVASAGLGAGTRLTSLTHVTECGDWFGDSFDVYQGYTD